MKDRTTEECPVLAAFVRQLNDEMGEGAYGEWNPHGDALRAKYLSDLFPMLVGTRSTPEVELKRAYIFADGAVRVLAPLALEAAGRADAAARADAARAAAAAARDAYAAYAYAAAYANAAANAANAGAWVEARVLFIRAMEVTP